MTSLGKGEILENLSCEIGGMIFNRSLLDSRASVNVMPKALYEKFKFGDLEPIMLELQLFDGSIRELITQNLYLYFHNYYCKLRHKTSHSYACYHTLSAYSSFFAI